MAGATPVIGVAVVEGAADHAGDGQQFGSMETVGGGREGFGVTEPRRAGGMTTWLHEQRLDAVRAAILASGGRRILDLGCGQGDLLIRLKAEAQIEQIVGIDRCPTALQRTRERLRQGRSPGFARIGLINASVADCGTEYRGFDCATLIEMIEHIQPARISAVECAVFRRMRPSMVVVTTPNAEFNPLLGVPRHRARHPGHQFEWDRAQFRRWAGGVAARNRYLVTCSDIAGCHPRLGGASQMAVFKVATAAAS